MIKDSQINLDWLREQMRLNPPCVLQNGNLFSGPVRLSFPNIFKPGKPGRDAPAGAEGKFGAALLFPPGTDMAIFRNAWTTMARSSFPQSWDPQGNPIGLHSPFHDQAEKAYGPTPRPGYTPGAPTFNCSSNFKPPVVDVNRQPLIDEARVYPGVWAFVAVNCYKFQVPQKKGISFGLQTVMIIADDKRLGGGAGDPNKDFAAVRITVAPNAAAAFAGAPVAGAGGPTGQAPSLYPSGGYAGTPGTLPIQPLPVQPAYDDPWASPGDPWA